MLRRRPWGPVVCLVLLFLALDAPLAFAHRPPQPPPPPRLTVLGTVRVGREPLGVAIHEGRAQAVVANRASRSISVVDLLGGAVLATIPVGRDPLDVAVNPRTDMAVVTLAAERALAVVNLDTLDVIAKVRVGHRPTGVAVDPALNVAVVANRDGRSVTVVDLLTRAVVATARVGRRPVDVAVNPLTHVFAVANEGDGTVTLLDLSDPAHPASPGVITLPGSRHHALHGRHHGPGARARPSGIAFDYSPTLNRLVVADPGLQGLHILTLSPSHDLLSARLVRAGARPSAVAVNPGTDFAFVTSDRDDVFGVALTAGAVVGKADVGKRPRGVAIDPVTCRGAVTSSGSRGVSLLFAPCPPRLNEISPPAVQVGTTFTLTLTGFGFGPDARVNVGGAVGLVPASLAPERITLGLTAPAVPGFVPVSVTANGQTSNSLSLQVSLGPPPVLTGVSPATGVADGEDYPIVLTGRNFASGARVIVYESDDTADQQALVPTGRTCDPGGNCVLTATIPGYRADGTGSHFALHGGTLVVQVENPGGVRSGVATIELASPMPVLADVRPSNALQGSGDTVIALLGSGFMADVVDGSLVALTQVLFDGVPLAATAAPTSPTRELSVTVPTALLQTPGDHTITAFNLGDGLSTTHPFSVVPATPPDISVTTFPIPQGLPRLVAALRQGTSVLGAVALPGEGLVRLLDLTNPAAPAAIGGSIGLGPSGFPNFFVEMAADPLGQRLVVPLTNDGALAVVSVADPLHPALARIALPDGVAPLGVAVDPTRGRAIVTDQNAPRILLVDLATGAVATIDLPGAQTILSVAVNPATNVAAVVDQQETGQTILRVDLASGAVTGSLLLGDGPVALAIHPLTNKLIATNQATNEIVVIDFGAATLTGTRLLAGDMPAGVAVDPNGTRALVSNEGNNELTVVNLQTNTIAGRLFIGQPGVEAPADVAWVADVSPGVVLLGDDCDLIGCASRVTVVGLPPGALP